MIGKLKGLIDCYGEDYVILDVGGVGYQVHCASRTLQALPAPGEAAVLSIETYVREDQIKLFGFRSDLEREWFRLLQTVQGVGAKVALAVLGTLPPSELANAIALRDKATVARTPGVGQKVAERIVTELKDKAPAFSNVDPALVHLAGSHRRPSRAAPGHRRDLRAGQSRLRPAAGRRRHRRRLAQRRRGRGDGAADPARAEGAGAVSVATSHVVPANAGTHNQRCAVMKEGRCPRARNSVRRIWVPAFAETTRRSTHDHLPPHRHPRTPQRRCADTALRPQLLSEFVGQQQARANLSIFIDAARKRGEALDHVLFVGPPGSARPRWRRSWRANSASAFAPPRDR